MPWVGRDAQELWSPIPKKCLLLFLLQAVIWGWLGGIAEGRRDASIWGQFQMNCSFCFQRLFGISSKSESDRLLIHCPLSCADKDMHSAASPSTNASATCRNTVRFCCSALWASPAVPEPNTCGGELIIISHFQYLSSILLKYPKMIWIHNYFFPRTACFAFNVTGSSFKHCLKFFFCSY